MIRDGDFNIYKNSSIREFCYKIIPNKSIEELKAHCISDEKCLGFDTTGKLFFYVPLDKLKTNKDITSDIYLYRKRQSEYDSKSDDKCGSIPKLIHYIWFSKGRSFNIVNYIAIKTALKHCHDYKIYLHCDAPPTSNIYYDLLKDKITTNIIESVDRLNGHNVQHFQHKADIARLRILKEMGGIYLDIDILLIKPLDQFLNNKFVIGYENSYNTNQTTNAVIMTEPNNQMICEWLDIYNISWGLDFIAWWTGHSVIMPYQLSYKYGYMMNIQDHKTFYPFLWTDYSVFDKTDNNKNYDESVSLHLWDTELYKTNLPPIAPHYFRRMRNAFTRLFGEYVSDIPLINPYHTKTFIQYEGFDIPDNDIRCYGRISVDELKWICNETQNCIGFNTLGFMKNKFDEGKLVKFDGRPYCRKDDSFYLISPNIV